MAQSSEPRDAMSTLDQLDMENSSQGQSEYSCQVTSRICGSIQLGILETIANVSQMLKEDKLLMDFSVAKKTNFTRQGSETTPAHSYSDFQFKSYAPGAFKHLRDLFGVSKEDFLVSFCTEPMNELCNPGASGSLFNLTFDDEFIIKTLQQREAKFLQKFLPHYYMYTFTVLCESRSGLPHTLLPKFLGLYRYTSGTERVRVVAMNNLLPTSIKFHEKYDLKGSTYKRQASKHEKSKESPTFKDLDFIQLHPQGISLDEDTYDALMDTLDRDCKVLRRFKVMDYSLLVGVHNLDRAASERANKFIRSSSTSGGHSSSSEESSQSEAASLFEEHVPPGAILGKNEKGERLLLFVGIIDILQSYRLKKKVEHSLKSMVIDGDTVSVHRPSFYASRFIHFITEKVFRKVSPPQPKAREVDHFPGDVGDGVTNL